MEMGKAFYFKLIGGIFAIGVAAFLGFVVFSRLVYQLGLIVGVAIVVGILMLIAALFDRKKRREYEEQEREYEASKKGAGS